MQPAGRVVEALRSYRQAPPQSRAGSLSSDVDSTAAAAAADNNKRCGYELKQVRRCLVWFLEACMLLLLCLGLPVLVEFVIVHPRPPGCDRLRLNSRRSIPAYPTPVGVQGRLVTLESMQLGSVSFSQQSSLL